MMEAAEEATEAESPRRQALGVFDAQRPPSRELISDCVHCGFCLSTCPTYLLWGQEADSPRGRIYLMKLGLEGQANLAEPYVQHFDRCLGCMACLTSCPSGVQYDKLIEATRAQVERRYQRTASDRIFRRLLFAIFPFPQRLRVLALPLWIYQRSGLRSLVRKSGLLRFLPQRLTAMESLLPPVKLRSIFGSSPVTWPSRPCVRSFDAKSEEDQRTAPLARAGRPCHGTSSPRMAGRRLRVGLLLGCVQRVFFDEVNQATARVLAAEGCTVVAPASQGCCGALALHAGEEPMAIRFAKRMIDAFDEANVDVIAINSAGCGSAMKEYAHLLRDDPDYAERAKAFSVKCRDVSEILAEVEPRAVRHAVPMRAAYHDACHLQHAQRITSQPRQLLQTIPRLTLVEIEEAGICCGSAGVYNLLQPKAAAQLGARKAEHVFNTRADVLVSANPGCLLQIDSSLRAQGRAMPTLHWIQLLDAAIQGRMPKLPG